MAKFTGKEKIKTKNAIITMNTAKLAKLVDPKRVVNKAVRADLARRIQKESLDLVAVGKSPVKGEGRFTAYAAQRKTAKPKPRKVPTRRKKSAFKRLVARVKKFFSKPSNRPRKSQGAKELSGLYPEIRSLLAKYPSKKTRPVNLALDPKKPYLKSLWGWSKVDGGISFLLPQDDFLKMLFEVHNEGMHPDVPQRKVVPTEGDDYVAGIKKVIKNIYSKRIRSIIKSNG